jgi:hypothetical protein
VTYDCFFDLLPITFCLQKQVLILTTKVSEETSKRHKAEERAKMVRDFAETAKVYCCAKSTVNKQ